VTTAIAPSPSRAHSRGRQQSVVAFYRAGVTTDRIARLTHLSRRRVTEIVRQSIAEVVREAGVEKVRLQLYVDLEEAKAQVQNALLFSPDLSPRERNQLFASLVKIVHEQALLIGAHAQKQLHVTEDIPETNEQAEEYARGVVEFMNLADKIAASGYGSGRTPPDAPTDFVGYAGTVETDEMPELLRQYEAGELVDLDAPHRDPPQGQHTAGLRPMTTMTEQTDPTVWEAAREHAERTLLVI
jgi:hypothetical protein